jgi:hypothetical protein
MARIPRPNGPMPPVTGWKYHAIIALFVALVFFCVVGMVGRSARYWCLCTACYGAYNGVAPSCIPLKAERTCRDHRLLYGPAMCWNQYMMEPDEAGYPTSARARELGPGNASMPEPDGHADPGDPDYDGNRAGGAFPGPSNSPTPAAPPGPISSRPPTDGQEPVAWM